MKRDRLTFGSFFAFSLIWLVAIFFTGCGSVDYYGQAISGHFKLLIHRQPIVELIVDPKTPADVKQKLKQVQAMRVFADTDLHLPVKGHFTKYVHLDRPYVAWAVFAAPELSLKAKTWCYPVIGCTAYRGFFDIERARKLAQRLKNDGYDVYVSGISAYSTLGWFEDPLLSTAIKRSDADLAALIFHELAHQILYVDDDTDFNEGFATAVEQAGLKRWLEKTGDLKAFSEYRRGRRLRRQFSSLILTWRNKLGRLYDQQIPDYQKKAVKKQIIAGLRDAYVELKASWGGYAGYDAWFNGPLNNAQLNAVAAYDQLAPAFLALLKQKSGNFEQFYAICQQLAKLPKAKRRRQLNNRFDEKKQNNPTVGQLDSRSQQVSHQHAPPGA